MVHPEHQIPQLHDIAMVHGVIYQLAIQRRAGKTLGEVFYTQPMGHNARREFCPQARQSTRVMLVPMRKKESDSLFQVYPVGAELVHFGREARLAPDVYQGKRPTTVERVDYLVPRLGSEHPRL